MTIICKLHPKYHAKRRPSTDCDGCHLLYILRWQHEDVANEKLGGLNPYQFLRSVDGGCEELRVKA